MEWSNEKVLRLIAEYRARPLLWDPHDQNYKNKMKKNSAWEEIAEIFELPRPEVERKFKILLVQYRREKAKIWKMVDAGYDLAQLEANAWYGYKSFEFFNNKYSSNASMDVSDVEQTDFYNDEELAEVKIEPVSEDYNGENNVENFLESTLQEIPQNKKRKISKPTDLTLKCKHNFDSTDDINVFASYIASEMRNLSNQKVRRKLKRNILRALLEACEEDDRIQIE